MSSMPSWLRSPSLAISELPKIPFTFVVSDKSGSCVARFIVTGLVLISLAEYDSELQKCDCPCVCGALLILDEKIVNAVAIEISGSGNKTRISSNSNIGGRRACLNASWQLSCCLSFDGFVFVERPGQD